MDEIFTLFALFGVALAGYAFLLWQVADIREKLESMSNAVDKTTCKR